MYNIMRITALETNDIHYLPGHDKQDAIASFGTDIIVQNLIAISDDHTDMIDSILEEQGKL